MKRHAQLRERHPLRHRFEMVDRLDRLDLDDAEQLAAALALQHEIRVPRGRSPHWRRLLVAWVDRDFGFSLIFRLKQANDAVVLELLSDRPHEDWAHTTSDACEHFDVPEESPASKGLNIARDRLTTFNPRRTMGRCSHPRPSRNPLPVSSLWMTTSA